MWDLPSPTRFVCKDHLWKASASVLECKWTWTSILLLEKIEKQIKLASFFFTSETKIIRKHSDNFVAQNQKSLDTIN